MSAAPLLVALWLFAPPFRSVRYGDWYVTSGAAWWVAATTNELNVSIGLVCTADDCVGFMESGHSCTDGGTVLMLLNSTGGSAHISATCRHGREDEGRCTLTIDDVDVLVAAIASGSAIGIALPLGNGGFNVLRFSTAGATHAIRQATEAMQARIKDRAADRSAFHPASWYRF